jgi:hypothetical protein
MPQDGELYVPNIIPQDEYGGGDDVISAAIKYAKAGWYVGPVKNGSKHPGSVLGKKWQDKTTRDPWIITTMFAGTDNGIFLHCGRSGAVVLDVDRPERIPEEWWDILNAVPAQSTRESDPARGHYIFKMPEGDPIGSPNLPNGAGEVRGINGVIIVAPSQHEKAAEGGVYEWLAVGPVPDMPGPILDVIPRRSAGSVGDAATDDMVRRFLDECTGADSPAQSKAPLDRYRASVEAGASRHASAIEAACWVAREAAIGLYPALDTLRELHRVFVESFTPAERAAGRGGEREWPGIVAWAVGQLTPERVGATRERHDTSAYDMPDEDDEDDEDDVDPDEYWGSSARKRREADGEPDEEHEAILEAFRSRFMTTTQLRDQPPAVPIVSGLLYRHSLASIYGPSGSLKSFVSLDIACRVATGATWAGRRTRKGKVLYLVAEGAGGFGKRVEAWEETHGVTVEDLTIYPAPIQVQSREWDLLTEVAAQEQWDMIFLDTRHRITVDLEENSAKDAGILVERCEQLRDAAGACVVLVHHSGWDGTHQRGASAVPAAMDTELAVKAERIGPQLRTTVTTTKAKDDVGDERVTFVAQPYDLGRRDDLGRSLTSLVLEHLEDDRPTDEDVTGEIPAGIAYTEAGIDLITVMQDLAPKGGEGLTIADLVGFLGSGKNRHPKLKRSWSKATVHRQFKLLRSRGEVARVAGTTGRYVILPDHERAEALRNWAGER